MRRRAFFELVTDPARNISEENILELESVFGRNLAALPRNAMAQVFALMRWNLGKGLSIPEIPTLVISATNDRVAPVAEGLPRHRRLFCRAHSAASTCACGRASFGDG